MKAKNMKRSFECTLKSGTRTIIFRNSDVHRFTDLHRWAQTCLTNIVSIFGDDWELVNTADRTKR